MIHNTTITSDGFVWLNVHPDKARAIFDHAVLDLYEVRDDGEDALIETEEELEEVIKHHIQICIEVGFLKFGTNK